MLLVCGKKESTDNTVTVRRLGSDKQEVISRNELIKKILVANKLPIN
jgi:threonyl-tRNA synthetase